MSQSEHPVRPAPPSPYEDLETVLVSEDSIKRRLKELGSAINLEYGDEEVAVIAIINGAIIFTADLIRELKVNLKLDCIRVSSYRDSTSAQGEPEILDVIRLDLRDRHVLLIDDILDTGATLNKVVSDVKAAGPKSVKTCILLDKQGRRVQDFEADFVGFEIPNEFVVGYGLDFAERYRHLPCIGILKPEAQNPPEWT
ncbi:MAG: hypoxanthine phosphoribosyltransferase [Opitutales bacterium]